jgi:hypothetical protein
MSNILEFTLPISGKSATMRRPTGRDSVEAEHLVGPDYGPIALQIGILSRVVSIEGKILPYEDFQALDMADINFIREKDWVLTRTEGFSGTF